VARYEVRNLESSPRPCRLDLVVRPFQVNPPAQFLNTPGGVAPLREIAREGSVMRVNGDRCLLSLNEPTAFGAVTFDQGDIVADYLRRGGCQPRIGRAIPRSGRLGPSNIDWICPPAGRRR